MSNRNGLSLFLAIVAALCLGWAIKSPAAMSAPAARPAPVPHCSQALANTHAAPAMKREAPSGHAGQRLCVSALRRRAA